MSTALRDFYNKALNSSIGKAIEKMEKELLCDGRSSVPMFPIGEYLGFKFLQTEDKMNLEERRKNIESSLEAIDLQIEKERLAPKWTGVFKDGEVVFVAPQPKAALRHAAKLIEEALDENPVAIPSIAVDAVYVAKKR